MKQWLLVVSVGLGMGLLVGNASGGSSSDIELKPTSAAPSGAGGLIEVERPRPTPERPARLTVTVRRLGPGNYYLTGEIAGARTPLFLGLVPIQDPTVGPEREEGTSGKDERHIQESRSLQVKVETDLPPRLAAADLNRLMITDQAGAVLLEGRPGRAR